MWPSSLGRDKETGIIDHFIHEIDQQLLQTIASFQETTGTTQLNQECKSGLLSSHNHKISSFIFL